jgi:hypothetical protein
MMDERCQCLRCEAARTLEVRKDEHRNIPNQTVQYTQSNRSQEMYQHMSSMPTDFDQENEYPDGESEGIDMMSQSYDKPGLFGYSEL